MMSVMKPTQGGLIAQQKPSSQTRGLGVDWPAWTAPAALLSGVVMAAVGALLIEIPAALLGVRVDNTQLPPGLVIAGTAVQDCAFVLAAVIFAGVGGRAVHAWQLGLRPTPLGRGARLVLFTLLAFFLFSVLWSLAFHPGKEELLKQLGVDTGTTLLILASALTCVVAPICEELLFRGFFFVALSTWRGPLPAALITGLVFGAVHLFSAPALDLVPLAVLGFALCLLYRRTGSLYPCIATHCLNNSIAFGALEHWSWQIPVLMVCALSAITTLGLALRSAGVITSPPTVVSAT
jgi:uncharacterized protein